MKRPRKHYSAELKARVALAALKGDRTVNEVAGHFEVHPTQVATWRRQALQALPDIFSGRIQKADIAAESLQASLYEEIGRLKVELDWLKKKLRPWT